MFEKRFFVVYYLPYMQRHNTFADAEQHAKAIAQTEAQDVYVMEAVAKIHHTHQFTTFRMTKESL